jgi:Flp pilus assembly protein TadD
MSERFRAESGDKSSIVVAGDRRSVPARGSALALLLALLGAIAAALTFVFASRAANGVFGFPLDDPWIHLSFARTLAETGRFADFPGGPTTAGSTSPLFTLLETVAWLFTHDEYLIGYGLGIAAFLISIGLIFELSRTRHAGAAWSGALAALVLATEPKLVGVAVSAMETTTTIAMLLLAALQAQRRRWKTVGVVAGLLLWTRPDTLIFSAALALQLLYEAVVEKPPDRSKMSRGLLTFGGLALGYFAFNWALSGTPFPNSLAAKLEYYRRGNARFGADLWSFLTDGGMAPAIVLFLVGLLGTVKDLARRRPAAHFYAYLFVIALVAAYRWKLPFLYQNGRYLIPIIPFVVLGMIDGVGRIAGAVRGIGGARARTLAGAFPFLVALAIVGLNVSRLPGTERDFADRSRHIGELQVATARWCRDHLPPTAIVAAHDVGALGFYSRRSIVDVVGLLDRGIQGHIGDPEATLSFMRARHVTHLAFLTDWIEVPNENPLMRTNPAGGQVMQVLPFTATTEISSPSVTSLNLIAERRLATGDVRGAWAALSKVSRVEPTNARTHYLEGLAFTEVGALDRAELQFRLSLQYFPTSAKALSALGRLASHKGENQEAARFLRQAVDEDPLNLDALTVLVDVLAHLPDRQAERAALSARLQEMSPSLLR